MEADQRRVRLSCLWAFVALNIAFADILSLYTPGVMPQVMEGVVEGVELSENLMLVAAIFIQIPVAMIVLTQFLSARANKVVSTIAVVITAAFVIGGGSLMPHYVFFATCEVLALLLILRLIWRPKV